MPSHTLVIAYGNPLRCDDGVGWRAAGLLQKKLSKQDVAILYVHQLTPELAEWAANTDRFIFVDAAANGIPGQVHFCEANDEDPGDTSSHWFTPAQVLALSQTLYGKRPKHFVVSVVGASFELGDKLSPVVEDALPELVDTVANLAAVP